MWLPRRGEACKRIYMFRERKGEATICISVLCLSKIPGWENPGFSWRAETKKGQRQIMGPKERLEKKKMGCSVLDSKNDHLFQKRDWKKKNGMLCPRLQKWSFTFRKYRFTKSPADSPIPSYFTHCLRILAWDPDLVSSRQELNDLQGLDSGWWILASS